jgi:hypothetical protein
MKTQRQVLIDEVFRRLGGGMVTIELTPDHYDDALNTALNTYRQRSANSVEERYTFLNLIPDQSVYQLPQEIVEVREIFRGGVGGVISGSSFEPFGAQMANQMYLGGSGSSSMGSLVTYELFTGFQDLVGTMFGRHIMFTWQPVTKRLELMRQPRGEETVMLWVYQVKGEENLLIDPYARPWLLRYTLAISKMMLGEARSRFGSFIGPQGGTTLNGDALKSEGQMEIDNLHLEISNQVEQNIGYGFLIG